jgi:hypothetical protein
VKIGVFAFLFRDVLLHLAELVAGHCKYKFSFSSSLGVWSLYIWISYRICNWNFLVGNASTSACRRFADLVLGLTRLSGVPQQARRDARQAHASHGGSQVGSGESKRERESTGGNECMPRRSPPNLTSLSTFTPRLLTSSSVALLFTPGFLSFTLRTLASAGLIMAL